MTRFMATSALDRLGYLRPQKHSHRAASEISIRLTNESHSLTDLLKHITKIGNTGHSFQIIVDPDNRETRRIFSWDGDGSDRIWNISETQAKAVKRDYEAEYRDYHSKPKHIKERAQRNAARAKLGLKIGDPREADHKNPISNGGSNSKRNLRAVSRDTNRHKADKAE